MTDTVAVVVAHPDDEVLACGGAIARLARRGSHVEILILATGLAARGQEAMTAPALSHHREAAEKAAHVLGARRIHFDDLPDNRMDTVALLDVIQKVEKFFAKLKPQLVFTHHPGDANVDHGVTARAVLTASRPIGANSVRRILAGEVQSSSEWGFPSERFQPTSYVDISADLETKLAALACYAHELRPFPHPRSPEAVRSLASVRGSEAGVLAAEAFYVLRDIEAP